MSQSENKNKLNITEKEADDQENQICSDCITTSVKLYLCALLHRVIFTLAHECQKCFVAQNISALSTKSNKVVNGVMMYCHCAVCAERMCVHPERTCK